jgi:hypothetical protein
MYTITQINPPYLLVLYCPDPVLFSSSQCSTLYYLHTQMQCFHMFHSQTFSFPLCSPLRSANAIMFSLPPSKYIYTHMYIISYMYLCVNLSSMSSFCIWGKTCGLWPLFFPEQKDDFIDYFYIYLKYDESLYLFKTYFSLFFLITMVFFNSFSHKCIHCLGHFSPYPLPPPSPPHPPLLPGRTCSALISNLVEEKT